MVDFRKLVQDKKQALADPATPGKPLSTVKPDFAKLVADKKAGIDPTEALTAEQKSGDSNILSGLFELFTGAKRQTEETRTLPEIGGVTAGSFDKNLRIAAGLLSSVDPIDQIDIIKKTAPGVIITEDSKGNTIVDFGKGQKAVLNKPGASFQDVLQTTAQILSFIPASKLANFGKSLLVKVVLGTTGAAVTETALQAGTSALGGEQGLQPGKITTAGVFGGASELVQPAIGAFKSKKDIIPDAEFDEALKAITKVAKPTEKTGVQLFPAQKTLIPSELEKQSFIASLPAGSKIAQTALRKQNQQAADAVDNLLNFIAPAESIISGPLKFRNAARRALDITKEIRKERASPIYKNAFSVGGDVDLKPVFEFINTNIKDFPIEGGIAKALLRVKKLVATKKPTIIKPSGLLDASGRPIKPRKISLKVLHGAKLDIDEMLNKFGENSLGNTSKKLVTDVKNILIKQMDEASGLYKLAREEFATASPPITALQNSIIGKVADLSDIQLKSVSRTIFDAAETNPTVVKNAKKIIDAVDPDAWNKLLRTELERRIGSIRVDLTEAGQTIENVPAQLFNAIFGNIKQREILFNATEGEIKQNLKWLKTQLSRAKLGRPGGSQTATREEIKKELRGGAGQAIRNFLRQPISSAISAGEDVAFNRRVKALADVLFNPDWKPQLSKIRKMSPNSKAALKAMAQLLNDSESSNQQGEQR